MLIQAIVSISNLIFGANSKSTHIYLFPTLKTSVIWQSSLEQEEKHETLKLNKL